MTLAVAFIGYAACLPCLPAMLPSGLIRLHVTCLLRIKAMEYVNLSQKSCL